MNYLLLTVTIFFITNFVPSLGYSMQERKREGLTFPSSAYSDYTTPLITTGDGSSSSKPKKLPTPESILTERASSITDKYLYDMERKENGKPKKIIKKLVLPDILQYSKQKNRPETILSAFPEDGSITPKKINISKKNIISKRSSSRKNIFKKFFNKLLPKKRNIKGNTSITGETDSSKLSASTFKYPKSQKIAIPKPKGSSLTDQLTPILGQYELSPEDPPIGELPTSHTSSDSGFRTRVGSRYYDLDKSTTDSSTTLSSNQETKEYRQLYKYSAVAKPFEEAIKKNSKGFQKIIKEMVSRYKQTKDKTFLKGNKVPEALERLSSFKRGEIKGYTNEKMYSDFKNVSDSLEFDYRKKMEKKTPSSGTSEFSLLDMMPETNRYDKTPSHFDHKTIEKLKNTFNPDCFNQDHPEFIAPDSRRNERILLSKNKKFKGVTTGERETISIPKITKNRSGGQRLSDTKSDIEIAIPKILKEAIPLKEKKKEHTTKTGFLLKGQEHPISGKITMGDIDPMTREATIPGHHKKEKVSVKEMISDIFKKGLKTSSSQYVNKMFSKKKESDPNRLNLFEKK